MFAPDFVFSKITDIPPNFLEENGLSALILDVDNTLSVHGSQIPFEGVEEWIRKMEAAQISLLLVSNNFKKRVSPFAEKLGLGFISMSCKPLPLGIPKALKRLQLQKKEVAIVGDQIYTDVFGGNLAGICTILVSPIEMEGGFLFKTKRLLEKPVLWNYNRKKKGEVK